VSRVTIDFSGEWSYTLGFLMRPCPLLCRSSSWLLALACPASLALAGSPEMPSFSSRADLVVLSATAVDGRGRPVRDLKPTEIRIFDEGRPQPIAHFSHGRALSARLLLLVDASGSMNGQLKTASTKMAVVQILSALDAEDQAALAGFDSRYFGLVPFTTDRRPILGAFDDLTPFGSTALNDALDKAARDLASHGEGRRAVIVVTDGVDTSSQKTPDDVIASSKALDVPIYAVSVVSPLDDPRSSLYAGKHRTAAATRGAANLERYALMSGGRAFAVSDFKGLREAAGQIVDELKHQYRLGYDPPDGPPHFRRIEVKTTRRGVVVRTRNGYMPKS
jgi:Ca-activated chloride channel family protein